MDEVQRKIWFRFVAIFVPLMLMLTMATIFAFGYNQISISRLYHSNPLAMTQAVGQSMGTECATIIGIFTFEAVVMILVAIRCYRKSSLIKAKSS